MNIAPPTGNHRLIWNLLLSRYALPLVAICDEMGVLTALAHEPLTVAAAAERFELTPEWAEIVFGTLSALELTRIQDNRVHVTDTTRTFLVADSPYYCGGTVQNFVRGDSNTEKVKRAMRNRDTDSDRYIVRDWRPDEYTRELAESGATALHGLSFATAVGTAYAVDFSPVRRLLDVAGGAGTFAIAIAMVHSTCRCTVAELPTVCEVSERYIRKFGVEDRVETTPLNMFFEPWPTGYDAIMLSNVLHDWAAPQRTFLMQQAFDALPPGGRLYINEMLMSDTADAPFGPVLFNLGMRVGTAGKQFTAPELRGDLESVGFTSITFQNTYGYFSLTTAFKPDGRQA